MKENIYKLLAIALMLFFPIVPFVSADNAEVAVSITILSADSLIPFTIKAIPEKRVYVSGGNEATNFRLRFVNPSTEEIDKESTFTTSATGLYSSYDMSSFNVNDTYHIYGKGESHLTDKEASVQLTNSSTTIDFSNGETDELLAGDVNGVDFGDDIVNAIDLSILITDIDTFDARTDLNKDGIVNALDLSAMITNIDEVGDV